MVLVIGFGFGKLLCPHIHMLILLMNTFPSTVHVTERVPVSKHSPFSARRDGLLLLSLHYKLHMLCSSPSAWHAQDPLLCLFFFPSCFFFNLFIFKFYQGIVDLQSEDTYMYLLISILFQMLFAYRFV